MCVPGYHCEPHNNPADFFLDVINGDSTATTMTKVHGSEGNGIYESLHENYCQDDVLPEVYTGNAVTVERFSRDIIVWKFS